MLEKMGNCLIGFDEMNSGHLIDMLGVIEARPQPIWDAIKNTYSKKFFNAQIEADFGITPNIMKNLNEKFEKRVQNHKNRFEKMVYQLTSKFNEDSFELQNKVTQLESHMKYHNDDHAVRVSQEVDKIVKSQLMNHKTQMSLLAQDFDQ